MAVECSCADHTGLVFGHTLALLVAVQGCFLFI
jgi:hypothetical protein